MMKTDLRTKYLRLRESLTDTAYQESNRKICANFFSSVDISRICILHTFLPITTKREPDTLLIIEHIRRSFSTVTVSIPRVNRNTNELESVNFEKGDPINTNAWGIPEPAAGIHTSVKRIDLVIVPLLTFDESGNRVGYGKGFYDKFLSSCRTDTRKVGLSAFGPESKIDDAAVHDIRLDLCITPDRTYTF